MKWIPVLLLVTATVLSTGACGSSHLKKFIGKDARYIAVEDGPPAYVFDMPNGRRAFQYYWGGGKYYVPKTTTTQGQVQLVGNAAYYSEGKIESGGFVVESQGCLVTYFAEWKPEMKGWIVVGIWYPKRLVC